LGKVFDTIQDNYFLCLWVPAFAGTTSDRAAPAPNQILTNS
jgi:hypothetical protein